MSTGLERVRRLDIPAAHHRAVDVPALRDKLLESWRNGHLRMLLEAHPATKLHLPVRRRDERAGHAYMWTVREWESWLIERLAEAELFYVTHDMTDLVEQAAAAAPRYEVHQDRLPAEVGFVVYAHPYCVVPSEVLLPGQRVELSAALWAPVPDVGGGPEGAAPGVMLVTLQDTDVLLWTQPMSDLAGGTPASMRRVLEEMRVAQGPLSYHEEYPVPYGERPWGMEAAEGVKNTAVGAVMTTWILMGQRITTVEREPMPRHVRKAAARQGRPEPTVRCVTLRQRSRGDVLPADQQQTQPGQPSRQYTKRWVVRGYGYWRNTWYPSRERHEQQFVWVPSYTKGPQGAPLVGGERVNVLRR